MFRDEDISKEFIFGLLLNKFSLINLICDILKIVNYLIPELFNPLLLLI